MKYNNIDTLVAALEQNVNELAEAREEMTILEMAETKLKGEVAKLKLELAQTKAKLDAVEEEALLDALRSDRWQKVAEEAEERAEKAEEKLARLEKCRDHDFDGLIAEFAYQKWAAYNSELAEEIEANGAAKAIAYVIGWMYQVNVSAFFDTKDKDHVLIEVFDRDKPTSYYHWHEKHPMTKVEVK